MKTLLAALFINLLITQVTYARAPQIRLCYEDEIVYPWITGDQKGLAITQLKLIQKPLNIEFIFIRLPWKRCQIQASLGRVDGIIAASFSKDRTLWGTYPMDSNNHLDRESRTHTDSFYVYVRKNSKIGWDGTRFLNLEDNLLGVQLGYSVDSDLKNKGHKTNSSFTTAYDLLKALDNGMLNVAVLQNFAALKTLKEHPTLGQKIFRIDTPFKISDQYILLNTEFYKKNVQLSNKIWKTLAKSRKYPAYIKEEQALLHGTSSVKSGPTTL